MTDETEDTDIGIRVAKPIKENCDVCDGGLSKTKSVEVETSGYIVRFCPGCALEVGVGGAEAQS